MLISEKDIPYFSDKKLLIKKTTNLMRVVFNYRLEVDNILVKNILHLSYNLLLDLRQSILDNWLDKNIGVDKIIKKINTIDNVNLDLFSIISVFEVFIFWLYETNWNEYDLIWWKEIESRICSILDINSKNFDIVDDVKNKVRDVNN